MSSSFCGRFGWGGLRIRDLLRDEGIHVQGAEKKEAADLRRNKVSICSLRASSKARVGES